MRSLFKKYDILNSAYYNFPEDKVESAKTSNLVDFPNAKNILIDGRYVGGVGGRDQLAYGISSDYCSVWNCQEEPLGYTAALMLEVVEFTENTDLPACNLISSTSEMLGLWLKMIHELDSQFYFKLHLET